MSQIAVEAVFIVVLILANGLFAMSEIAVVSSRRARLQQRADEGDDNAKAALDLVKSPDKFLATVQIGITLVGILAGAFGGATIAESLALTLNDIPALAPHSETISLLLIVALITYLSLILGELVPKQLGLRSPERIAMLVARPMTILSAAVAPVVNFLNFSTRILITLLRVQPSTEPEITEEEIKILIGQGTETGVFERVEQDMVERVFRLGDLRVGALITPRTEMIWLDLADSVEVMHQKITAEPYSRYPVSEGNKDHIIGVVETNDLLIQALSDDAINLRAVLRQSMFVPESTPALKVLQLLRDTNSHMAMVIDEYGGLLGIITINHLLEEIITDAFLAFEADPMAIQREDGSWLLDGLLPVDEFVALLELEDVMEDQPDYQTLGGFMMSRIGRIPHASDYFNFGHVRFEVVDMDGRRVDKVLATIMGSNIT